MVVLYTIDCPKCKVLKKKLDNANISYVIENDKNIFLEKNIIQLPMLEVNGNLLTFKQAVDWINEGGKE